MIEFVDEKGMITPIGEGKQVDFAEVAVTAYSKHTFEALMKATDARRCGELRGSIDVPVYSFCRGGKKIAVYMSPIGAPAAVSAMEEIFACGVGHVVAFGICGSLVDFPPHTVVVPNRAFRDEGTSYHYLPAAEFIELRNSALVERSLLGSGVKSVTGAAWTTDGFYRETPSRAKSMRDRGCIAVDMECSALQAAADHRGKDFYTFFITADSLAGEEWEPNYILDARSTDVEEIATRAAVSLAAELA